MASNKVQSFVDALAPSAIAIGQQYGIDPKVIIGQAALETGWGDSVAGNNYFGIKGPGQTIATHEDYGNGLVPVTDSFRTYGGLADSMADYGRLIGTSKRYAPALKYTDPKEQANAIWKAGYATDKKYGEKMNAIIDMIPDLSPYGMSLGYAPRPATRPVNPALDAIGQATVGVPSSGARPSTPLDVQMATNPQAVLERWGTAPFLAKYQEQAPIPAPRLNRDPVVANVPPPITASPKNVGLFGSLMDAITGGINNVRDTGVKVAGDAGATVGREVGKAASNVNPLAVAAHMPGGILGQIFGGLGGLGGFNPMPSLGEAMRVAMGGSPNHPVGTVLNPRASNGGVVIQTKNGPINSIAQQHLRAQHGEGSDLSTYNGGFSADTVASWGNLG